MTIGCSPRELHVSFLSSLKTSPFFEVTNTSNGNILKASRDETFVTIEAACSPGVERLDIEDPPFDITTNVYDLKRRCAEERRVNFNLPVALLPALVSSEPGDFYQNLTLRASGVDSVQRQPMEQVEHLRILFTPPNNSLLLPNWVNIRATEGEYFSIRGRCEGASDYIKLSGPFSGSPKTVACSGTSFEQNVRVESVGNDIAYFTLEGRSTVNARAYTEITAPVAVDLVAPVVEITSLASGKVYNRAEASLGPLIVAGTCSEDLTDLTLQVWNGVNLQRQDKVSCSLARAFEYSIPWNDLSDGPLRIRVEQRDLAENVGSSEINIEKQTAGPGAFQVAGVKSTGTGDLAIDNQLKDLLPQIHLAPSAGAVRFQVSIYKVADQTAVCAKEANQLVIDFSGCYLQNLEQYVVRAVAHDDYGNSQEAPEFQFTTNFIGARIVSAETTAAMGSVFIKGESLELTVHTDRPVNITDTESFLKLNVTATSGNESDLRAFLVTPIGTNAVNSLTYRYTVPAGVYSSQLKILSISIGAGIVDAVTGVVVTGTLNPEAGQNAHSVTSKNIVIDSVPPKPPDIFYTVSSRITDYSGVEWTQYDDGIGTKTYLRITNVGTQEGTGWHEATISPYQFPTPSSGLGLGVAYLIEAYSKDSAGNASSITTFPFTSFSCPTNFAYVSDGLTNPFCVAMFEGRGSITNPVIQAAGLPAILTFPIQAESFCAALGEKYKVITNSQWQVLANLAVQDPTNWSHSNQVLKIGNVGQGFGQLRETLTADPKWPNFQEMHTRVFNLPSGQKIWDLSGNAAEFVMKDASAPFYVSPPATVELLSAPLKDSYGSRTTGCYGTYFPDLDPSKTIRCGFGSIFVDNSAATFLYRGSHAKSSESEAGVFTAQETAGTIGGAARCVFNP